MFNLRVLPMHCTVPNNGHLLECKTPFTHVVMDDHYFYMHSIIILCDMQIHVLFS